MSNVHALSARKADYDIHPLFTGRWSPRSFRNQPIEDAALFSLFEAARWAPSANNSQPWRFIYAKNGSQTWSSLLGLANENNQRWATNASVLIVLVSKTSHVRNGDSEPSPLRNHSLDAGAAWTNLALQATHAGLITHAIGGFDREKAREVLAIPEGFHIEILIAVGYQGERSALPEDIQLREQPTPRKALAGFYAEGRFNFSE
ncbi:nitroreductase family protein [Methylobacillus gramineus]|uniref:nitroreductase family protein n=1 Tax=Methylobacillus gramineus TaxID=755169 RepID=UPI001CFF9DD5|nr:nitroreductase family protein [Methylobacillus gramineus]MCB5184389.1 nitroreductase family protein [Methylobacillus gramineus]